MSFNIEVRKKQLHSLNQYITSSKDKVDSILSYLGWTGREVQKVLFQFINQFLLINLPNFQNTEKINCPINTKHRVPIEKIEKHVQKCCLLSSGYEIDEQFLSEPQTPSSSSILLGLNFYKYVIIIIHYYFKLFYRWTKKNRNS